MYRYANAVFVVRNSTTLFVIILVMQVKRSYANNIINEVMVAGNIPTNRTNQII